MNIENKKYFLIVLFSTFCIFMPGCLEEKPKQKRPSKEKDRLVLERKIQHLRDMYHSRKPSFYIKDFYYDEIRPLVKRRDIFNEKAWYYILKSQLLELEDLINRNDNIAYNKALNILENDLKKARNELGKIYYRRINQIYREIDNIRKRLTILEKSDVMQTARAHYLTGEYELSREEFNTITQSPQIFNSQERREARIYTGLCTYKIAHRSYIRRKWKSAVKEYDYAIRILSSIKGYDPQKNQYLRLAKRERKLTWNIIRE